MLANRCTWRDKMKKLHILSKLLKICQNERISTKFVFPNHSCSPSFLTLVFTYKNTWKEGEDVNRDHTAIWSSCPHDPIRNSLHIHKLFTILSISNQIHKPFTKLESNLKQIIDLCKEKKKKN